MIPPESLERLYRTFYEISPDLVCTLDENGIVLDVNQRALDHFGYSKDELIGNPCFDFIAEQYRKTALTGFGEMKKNGIGPLIELLLIKKDGDTFFGLCRGSRISKENENIGAYLITIQDISPMRAALEKAKHAEVQANERYDELKKTHKTLLMLEKKYENLYENSPDLLRTIDLHGVITDCNESYAKNLGYSKEEVVGMKIYDHTAEKNLDNMKEVFNSWKNGASVTNKEIWMKRKDGTIFPALLSATTFYQGDQLGSNTVIKDITELYEAKKKIEENEAHIREQYEDLQDVEKSKEEFLAMITHELKTPLVPIQGYVDILLIEKFGPLTNDQKHRLEIIKSNTKYLMKLMSDLLDVQKLELGQMNLNKENHDLADIIREVTENVKPDIEKHNIKMSLHLQSGIYCVCDRLRIAQVMNNLINNAVDFCPKENSEIFIKLHADDKNSKIIIKDNGIGIPKSKIKKIFVKFYQVDTSVTREHGGSGIGLAVCKGIVEAHNGKIWAESEGEGKGAEIHITLTLA
ncbi:MAG: PAS domain-containing sensor histidine kinase [Thaumarchaeota archaeon]|nr:PAS domain-containing sensor histidine kinase [Nitrososphaerota archaeon]